MTFKRKAGFSLIALALVSFVFSSASAVAAKESDQEDKEIAEKCPEAKAPPPPILDVNLAEVKTSLAALKDEEGKLLWTDSAENDAALKEIFESIPRKTKLEQFFQLLFVLQKNLDVSRKPVVVRPPLITNVLLAAKVFTDPAFPKKITGVELKRDDGNRPPLYKVQFSDNEVRFPINQGKGFWSWDQGMCQIAKELVFYPGFSFRLRTARNSKNLVVDGFDKVEIFGQFGTRKLVSIDLSYVDLEKVEFIAGTDEGKVKARVAQREFETNEHSKLFKFIGTMIPNTTRQRIDW
ncbi:MAG TPA: hypothetical protein VFX30_02110 [bacterium]|nr:hypothetical protein [bacterium]